jgi:hypothetical protein
MKYLAKGLMIIETIFVVAPIIKTKIILNYYPLVMPGNVCRFDLQDPDLFDRTLLPLLAISLAQFIICPEFLNAQ